MNWKAIINSLILVRIGQELGTDSPLARTVRDLIDMVLGALR